MDEKRDDKAGATTLDREALVRTATRAIHVIADGDVDQFRELFHPEATNRESIAEPPSTRGAGPAAFHASAEWLRSAFSDLAFTVRDAAVDTDTVVLRVTMSGRHTGDFVTLHPRRHRGTRLRPDWQGV